MPLNLVRRTKATFRNVLLGVFVIVVMCVALFTGVIYLTIGLNERTLATSDTAKEYGVWAAYQLDKEAVELKHKVEFALVGDQRYSLKDLTLNFDILYSRIKVLVEGQYRSDVRSNEGIRSIIFAVKDGIDALTPVFDKMVKTGTVTSADLQFVDTSLAEVIELTREFVSTINMALNNARGKETEALKASATNVYNGVLALTAFLTVVVVTMGLLMFFSQRSTKQIKGLNEQLQKAADDAEAGNKAKSTFLATMSHEIRTPLNGMIASIDLLSDTDLNDAQRRRLQTAKKSGDALLDIISDILDFSKLERGIVNIEPQNFNLRQIVDGVVDLIGPKAGEKNLDLRVSLPALTLRTDPARIRQVLFNLLGNAVKFTANGYVDLSATIEQQTKSQGMLRFEVRDSGIGINSEGLEKLFKEFSQVDNSISRRFGGTGLGLAISKRLVDAMGGEIGVHSTDGQGSTFWFTVPVTEIAEASLTADSLAGAAVEAVRAGARVLLVEDHPINQEVAVAILTGMGLDVVCATNGADAIEIAKSETLDLILMDIQMPIMNGLDATEAIKKAGVITPVVGLTGNAFTTDRDACFAVGMVDFISKPITKAKLQGHLSQWLPVQKPAMTIDAAAEPNWSMI